MKNRISTGTLIALGLGMITANFVYQMVAGEPDWIRAIDRSFFQFITLVGVWVASKFED